MADNSAAVQRVAARIAKSNPKLSHRQVTQKAAKAVRNAERKTPKK